MTLPPSSFRRFAAALAGVTLAGTFVVIVGPALHWITDYGVQREPLRTHPIVTGPTAQPPAGAPVGTHEGIAPSDPPAVPLAAVAATPGRVQTDQVATRPFTTLGVQLPTSASTAGPVLVRWQGSAGWSDWHELDVETDAGPDRGTTEARRAAADPGVRTEPLWIGDGRAYQVNLAGSHGTVTPQILLVRASGHHLQADSEPATAGAALPNQPAIHTRAEWGAKAPTNPISAASDLKMAIVHHSDTGNDYSPSQVPSILRSVQAFHIEGRDWSDIGYNFVVDKYGGVWEGRAGSIDQLSIGAHAEGFNTSTIGVMVIGNYSQVGPSAAALDGAARVIAWEFANHGVDPNSPVQYTSGGSLSIPAGETRTFPRIVGHRDVGATSCPGTFLYPHLGDVRALVNAKYPGAASPTGVVDTSVGGPNAIAVSGWAIDPSSPDPIEVHVYIDGVGTDIGPAADPRPDLAVAFPASGSPHGYSHVFTGLAPGPHQVCVFGINVGPGDNTLIRCATTVVPSGSPTGIVDTAELGPNGQLHVSGWSIDPDTAAPIETHVYVDGVGTNLGPTADARPDLGGSYPLYGAQHGFHWDTTVSSAPHQVCVFAINTGPGANTLLGCRQVTPPTGSPIGNIEIAGGGPDGTALVTGWTLDPDVATSIQVHVYLDGVGTDLGPTPVARPDIAAAFPGYGPIHGVVDAISGLSPGSHQACVFGIDIGPGANTLLGCRTINVPSGSPIGVLDAATAVGGGRVLVSGWTIDPDTAGSIHAHVYIDGVGTDTGPAAVARPDVAGAEPGYGAAHGFDWTSPPLAAGTHQVCAFGIDVGPGSNTLVGCRSVSV